MACISLSPHSEWLKDYVSLRNENSSLLLTQKVGLEETQKWIQKTDALIRLLVEEKALRGCYILYPSRDFEFAFFAQNTGEGCGSLLIEDALAFAKKRSAEYIWAKTLASNSKAKKCFIKNGFSEISPSDLSNKANANIDRSMDLVFFRISLS